MASPAVSIALIAEFFVPAILIHTMACAMENVTSVDSCAMIIMNSAELVILFVIIVKWCVIQATRLIHTEMIAT